MVIRKENRVVELDAERSGRAHSLVGSPTLSDVGRRTYAPRLFWVAQSLEKGVLVFPTSQTLRNRDARAHDGCFFAHQRRHAAQVWRELAVGKMFFSFS